MADRRSLAEKTGFDTLFLVLIGAILARAINGSAAFLTTIGCAFFLMLVHRVFAFIATRIAIAASHVRGCAGPGW